jgi:DNA-binding transcriptional regulator YdaS (Cro superfamily)
MSVSHAKQTLVRNQGKKLAIHAVGWMAALARGLKITRAAVSQWCRVPTERIIAVEALTGVPRQKLRPDLFKGARRRFRVKRTSLPLTRVTPGPKEKDQSRLSRLAIRATASHRERLPNRRQGETFDIECAGLRYTCSIGRFRDGRIAEIFLSNHKSNSAADTAARDTAIVASIALQFGASIETIRRALCRDSRGQASGPFGTALDLFAGTEGGS